MIGITDEPSALRTGTGEELFDYIADCLSKFLKDNEDLRHGKEYHLGFTFSYPCEQKAINHGVLQRWTKGFDISGVEGHDVVPFDTGDIKALCPPLKDPMVDGLLLTGVREREPHMILFTMPQ